VLLPVLLRESCSVLTNSKFAESLLKSPAHAGLFFGD